MSFYTGPAKSFKFQHMPNNRPTKPNTKRAFALGFVKAISAAPLEAGEKVAWIKYAAEALPTDEGVEPVAGPGPGFVPEGAPEEQQVQQLLEALPGNSPEEKLHAAVLALLEAQQAGAGEDGGVEDPAGGVEPPGRQIDPALLQQMLSQGGPAAGAPPMPPQGRSQAGGPPGRPPVGGPQG